VNISFSRSVSVRSRSSCALSCCFWRYSWKKTSALLQLRMCGRSACRGSRPRRPVVALEQAVLIARAGGDEDDRHVARAFAAAHQLGELEAVHLGICTSSSASATSCTSSSSSASAPDRASSSSTSSRAAAPTARGGSPRGRRRSGTSPGATGRHRVGSPARVPIGSSSVASNGDLRASAPEIDRSALAPLWHQRRMRGSGSCTMVTAAGAVNGASSPARRPGWRRSG
jgi:hypothetical protein